MANIAYREAIFDGSINKSVMNIEYCLKFLFHSNASTYENACLMKVMANDEDDDYDD
jgi:hypothetical protein